MPILTAPEAAVVFSLTAIVSVYVALNARIPAFKTPWLRLLLNPQLVGIRKEIEFVAALAIWAVLSGTTAVCVACVIRASEVAVGGVYHVLGYHGASSGKAGPVTLVVISLWVYLHWVSKARQIAIKTGQNLPRGHLRSSKLQESASGLVAHSLQRREAKWFLVLRYVYYAMPALLASVFGYFCRQTGIIVSACARLLLKEYGTLAVVLDFYRARPFHRYGDPDPRLDQIEAALQGCEGNTTQQAYTILIGLIRVQGFAETATDLRRYVGWSDRIKQRIEGDNAPRPGAATG